MSRLCREQLSRLIEFSFSLDNLYLFHDSDRFYTPQSQEQKRLQRCDFKVNRQIKIA